MLWFIIGLLVGCKLGVLIMALLAASRMNYNEEEIYQSKLKEKK